MISFEVMQRDGILGLYIRDYPCQGVNPSYQLFKKLDEAMADFLVDNDLAGDMRLSRAKGIELRNLNQHHMMRRASGFVGRESR